MFTRRAGTSDPEQWEMGMSAPEHRLLVQLPKEHNVPVSQPQSSLRSQLFLSTAIGVTFFFFLFNILAFETI